MNLSNFKVIPQSNITKAEPSLEDLKPLFVPEVVKPDLTYDEETKRFRVKLSFVKNLELTEGFTAITDDVNTYLIKTSETDANIDLRPKFLKSNVTQYFKSDYLRLLTKDLGNDLFLHETKIENYTAFLVSKDVKSPFIKENSDQETPPEESLPVITKAEQQVLTPEEQQQLIQVQTPVYLNDELDEKIVEEPSLF